MKRTAITSLLLLFTATIGMALLMTRAVNAKPPEPRDPCDKPNPPAHCVPRYLPEGTLILVSRLPAGIFVSGTAIDPDAPGPVEVVVEVNGWDTGRLVASGPEGSYSGIVAPRNGDVVCVWAINRKRGEDAALGCRSIAIRTDPFGYLDAVTPGPIGLHLRGWAIDPDTVAPLVVHIYVDDAFAQGITASDSRVDVGTAFPLYGGAHGFDLYLPAVRGQHKVCAYGINVGPGNTNTQLGCMTVSQGGIPNAPGLKVRAGYSGGPVMYVEVTDNSSDEEGFHIERSNGQTGPWSIVQIIPPKNGGTFIGDDKGVNGGVVYCYRATAVNIYGSATSSVACQTALLPPLPKPTNLGSAVGQTDVTLYWQDNAVNESHYLINRQGANTITLPANPGTGPMSANMTGLQPSTQYCFEIAPMLFLPASKANSAYDPAKLCVTTVAPTPTPTPQTHGIKTVHIWNCASPQHDGSVWYFDNSVGGWHRADDAPTSWTSSGCGPLSGNPAASIDLPDGHFVILALIIVDGTYCTTEDPSQSVCRHWETAPLLGDANGSIQYVNTP
jgi:hypothetical protein